MAMIEVVVIGAGPYGLVAAAHLRASGIEPVVFGEVMGFWKALPKGMLLRSEWTAAHLTDPNNPRSLFDYERAIGQPLPRRIPMTEWARYGEWFQRSSVPNVDSRFVASVKRDQTGFCVTLEDGESVAARRVVIATGLTNFAKRPAFAAHLPAALATHTADARDFSWLAGKNIAVLGGGQSALESSSLLREVDARVEIISRRPIIRWLSYGEANYRERTLKQKILRPPGALGPIGINWIVQIPELFRALPEPAKPFIFARAARPAGAGWLRDRVNGVVYTVNESIDSVAVEGEQLHLVLTSGETRDVDHLVLGSGYEVRMEGYRFLSPEIIANIGTRHGQPDLALGFESSIDGLYFIGPGSQESFGPLLHSVAGTEYAGKSVSRAIKKASLARGFRVLPLSLPSIGGVSVSTGRGH
jgi:hypothetical protein